MTAPLLYRYDDRARAAPFDDTGRLPGTVRVELTTYEIVRRTPAGAWIRQRIDDEIVGHERFMRGDARRPFAHHTPQAALESFVARKRAQIAIFKDRIARAERAIAEARLP